MLGGWRAFREMKTGYESTLYLLSAEIYKFVRRVTGPVGLKGPGAQSWRSFSGLCHAELTAYKVGAASEMLREAVSSSNVPTGES